MPAVFMAVGVSVIISVLFYKSALGLAWIVLVLPYMLYSYRISSKEKYYSKMRSEFKELMLLISGSIQAGYSVEKAFFSSEKELATLFGEKSVILPYLHIMNQSVKVNIPIEKAFATMAAEIKLEDARNLAEILSFAKRSGGDYGRYIRSTAIKIEDKISVQQEIETVTTEKRLEMNVMCAMPAGILAYVSVTSGDFIAPLYGNLQGILIMSGCIVLYGAMILIGKRVVRIDV